MTSKKEREKVREERQQLYMKRIPRIKHPKPSSSTSAPSSAGGGGKASHQPKRTPVSDKEMEAILLGGCV